jgi:hypothetical protein
MNRSNNAGTASSDDAAQSWRAWWWWWWWCGRWSVWEAGEVSQILAGRKDGCRSENGQCKTGGNCRAKTHSSRDTGKGGRRRW